MIRSTYYGNFLKNSNSLSRKQNEIFTNIIFFFSSSKFFRSCLANDPVCSDDFFQWLLVQVHTKDQHAITIDGFRLIYNEKLPNLRPETISMLGLNLFSQLCQLSRMRRPSTVSSAGVESSSNEENPNSNNDTNVKMDQLWKIALCAHNTDVSMKAIQVFHFYCYYCIFIAIISLFFCN